jgi:putative molybdopterin biosynthesis protein
MVRLDIALHQARAAAALSQEALARAAGISRQAYATIERGAATPSTAVALRLAQALQTTVEALFALPDGHQPTIDAELVAGPAPSDDAPVRVHLHQVGKTWLARPLQGGPPRPSIRHSLPAAQGLAHAMAADGAPEVRVAVEVWQPKHPRQQSIVAVGCDPAMGLVASHLQPRGVELAWFEQGSRAALDQLAKGQAHVAGCHLLDDATGQFNVPWVKRTLPFPATVVTFAVWDQGLMVPRGNPKGIRGVPDLARPGVFMVNRESGSGSRALLDLELARAGLAFDQLAGYNMEASSHLMIAEVVAMGMADTGVGVKAAAVAAGVDFIPLAQERYDLVIPSHFLDMEPIQQLLAALRRRELRRQVEALGGYDTTPMGLAAPAS